MNCKFRFRTQMHPDKVKDAVLSVSDKIKISEHFIARFLTRKGKLSILICVADYIGNNPFLKLQEGIYIFKKGHYNFVIDKKEEFYSLVTMLPKDYEVKNNFQVVFNEMNITCYKKLG